MQMVGFLTFLILVISDEFSELFNIRNNMNRWIYDFGKVH